MNKRYRFCVITPIPSFSGGIPVIESHLKLFKVLEPQAETIVWLSTQCNGAETRLSPQVTLKNIRSTFESLLSHMGIFGKLINHFIYQIMIMIAMLKLSSVDIFIFAFSADLFIIPIITAKIMKKKIIIRSDGRLSVILKCYYGKTNGDPIVVLAKMTERICYSLTDLILLDSIYLSDLYFEDEYRDKILDGSTYVELAFFKQRRNIEEREYQVGYIGRFSKEKGVLELVKALSRLKPSQYAPAIIIGGGDLMAKLQQTLIDNSIQDNIILLGWVSKEEVPILLGNIKIVILPSYREGLPNIVLEAMSSGCVVLATAVGGIPGVVTEEMTGFILKGNSDVIISKELIDVINHPNLKQISINARRVIQERYTYQAAMNRYAESIQKLMAN